MGKKTLIVLAAVLLFTAGSLNAADESRLMRRPDIHGDMIVFAYTGDLWTAPATGGTATRLTSHIGGEAFAKFSPDGKSIAFSASYDGNFDVYTIPSMGGVPKRLTFHPKADMMLDWHPSGRKVLFRSNKDAKTNPGPRYDRLYTIDADGGYPEVLPLFEGELTSYSPDGSKIAYNRIAREFRNWKRYRGGMEQNIWTYDFEKNKSEKLTDFEGTDAFPMWYGDVIYFISDRDRTMNIYSYDLHTKEVRRITDHSEFDVKWPSLGDDRIIYENGGFLYVLDLKTERTEKLTINVPSEQNLKREAFINAGATITGLDISASGKRAIFGARGEVFTVPAKKGEVRNLTRTPGIRERSPSISPDGKYVAYFSDRTGEYEVYIVKSDGSEEEKQITKMGGNHPFFMSWSPDSKYITFYDQLSWLYLLDVEKEKITKIDRDNYGDLGDFSWSADSKWIAYSKTGDNNFSSIYLYNIDEGKPHQVTGDLYNDYSPSFDPDGKYLYFLTDRTINIRFRNFEQGWEFVQPTTVCVTTLKADTPSPLAPESDEVEVKEEEKEEGDKKDEDKKDKEDEEKDEEEKDDKGMEIDLAGLESRAISLPIGSGNFRGLTAVSGKVIYSEAPANAGVISFTGAGANGSALKYFDMKEREEKTIINGINGWLVSASGAKILYIARGGIFGIIDVAPGKNVGDGSISTTLMVKTDPVAEWKQIFYEAWRFERDFFYVDNMHGVDWKKIRKRYEAFLPYLTSRGDLNYILGELQGELNVGHAYIGGGFAPGPRAPFVGGGYLGCDFEIDKKNSLYKFSKIYTGRNWDDTYRAPLAQTGIVVEEGDYLLEINGIELVYPMNVHELLEGTAGHQITIKVGKSAKDEEAKEYTIEPLRNDTNLRYADWVETNRQKVLKASGGKIGYLHVPDTNVQGLMEFGKYFFPQAGMDGIVVDVRYNSGGWIPTFFINKLGQRLTSLFKRRDREPLEIPVTAVKGHLACIINGYAGSGGDAFPYYFKQAGLGPLVGTTTWGGLVGYDRTLPLMDGGFISMPSIGFINLDGEYDVERIGVAPDIEVDNRPDLVVEGRDPQLEKAIEHIMGQIKKDPPAKKFPSTPKDPDRS